MTQPLNYQPSNSAVYYVPPKTLDVQRTSFALIITVLLAIVGSATYAIVQPRLNDAIVRFGAFIVAAIAAGVLGIVPVRYGRVYSPIIAGLIGAAITMLSLYVMWLVWVHDFLTRAHLMISWGALIFHPIIFRRLTVFISETGAWKYNDRLVKGSELIFYWCIEAAAILLCGVMFPIKSVGKDDPVCRSCGSRCARSKRLPRFAADREGELIASIENRDFTAMLAHDPPQNENVPELSLSLMSCPNCAQMHVLTLNKIAWHIDSRGLRKVKITPLVDGMFVTAAEADQVKNLGELVNKNREDATKLSASESGE